MKLTDYAAGLAVGSATVCGYNDCGLLVFQQGTLNLLLDCIKKNGEMEFAKTITLEPCPALPKNTTISSISVCPGGSKIALIGPSGCWIVRMNSQLWSQSAVHVQHWAQMLQEHFFCESSPIQPALWTRSSNGYVVKWIPTTDMLTKQHHIAALYDDNVIRIYNVDISLENPVSRIDFSDFLSEGLNSSVTKTNTYGLLNRLVSFCILTSFSMTLSFIAIDSEGEMYACEVDLSGEDSTVPRPLMAPPCLPCDPVDIFFVPHPLSHIFGVIGVIGSSRIITHLTLMPDDKGGFDLFAHDQLVVPCPISHSDCLATIHPEARGTYVISTANRLYYVNCMEWISRYVDAMENEAVTLPETSIHDLITILGSIKDKENGYGECVRGACAVMKARSEDSSSTLAFICSTDTPTLNATFVKQIPSSLLSAFVAESTTSATQAKPSSSQQFMNEINRIISSKAPLPQPVGAAGASEDDLLDHLDLFADTLLKNIDKDRTVSQMTLARVLALFEAQKSIPVKRTELENRLGTVMGDVNDLRSELDNTRDRMQRLERRLDLIVGRACGGTALTPEEEKMLKALKQHKRDLENMAIQLPKLNLSIQEESRNVLGPVRSFTTTLAGRSKNAQRCVREVECLVDRMNDLQLRVEKLTPFKG